jgi:hypothetical protein
MITSWADWVAWAGIVLPLAILAFSALLYVRTEMTKAKTERYNRFWEVMRSAGAQDGNIASKMAAFFEMRSYPEYTDVIIRLCENTRVVGSEGELLKAEMLHTSEYLKKTQK